MSLSLEQLSIYHQISKTSDSKKTPLVSNLNLTISHGTVLTLMGPSGCGKSTLLNVIAGHLSQEFYYDGKIILNNEEIQASDPHKRSIGILFQDDLLFPHLNVWENIAFALPNNIKAKERKLEALAALDNVGLLAIAYSMPHQISGGQRARVSLIRMLSAQPKAVLLDEPFSKLDPELRVNFRDWVFKQLAVAQVPTLMVTHDKSDAPTNGKIIHWEQFSTENSHA
ncbi:ATP-binding cassette domain-containing protein [Vibrio algivorus]|uniref:ATP-binding cassette domain-containing protein n=1 Tax=Vibrio algivorus TaxID=1667024 RepID=A0A557PFS7_9VIBR|nr:ATP-binding cassette domain-containing protein [Vibrio algivorus]TVO39503.1 ATP-binding cassette domain-containing protein [Vibrio algivorus]